MAQSEREALFAVVRPMLDEVGFNDPARIEALNRAVDAIEAAARGETVPAVAPATPAPAAPAGASTYDRAALRAELIRDEGVRLQVYRCTAGKLTIGVGRNLDDVGISAEETAALGLTVAICRNHGVTRAQAEALLNSDIDKVEQQLDRSLSWWRQLNDARQRVLLNMAFNLGTAGLLGFKNTLAMVRDADYAGAARNMLLSKWAKQVGARSQRLAAMMRDGR